MGRCFFCGETSADQKAGFHETCTRCGRDLHVCRNCRFYEPNAYNECRETQAERVIAKDRANFCEYFEFGEAKKAGKADVQKKDPRAALANLFKK